VILDRSDESVKRFLHTHGTRASLSAQQALELLEMQRNAMLMFTSCGWFFSDISGIETVQVLHYAARVIQLAERLSGMELERAFLERISPARSNHPDRGNARAIYEREVMPARLDLGRVAAHYAVLSLFDSFDDDARVYCYDVTRRDFEIHKAGRARLAIGAIEVRSVITCEAQEFELAVLHLGETEISGGVRFTRGDSDYEGVKRELANTMEPGGIPAVIRLLDQNFGRIPISIRSLFRDEQRRILHELLNATLEEAESAFRQLHERYDPLMRFHTRLGIPVPKVLQIAAEFDLNLQIRRTLEQEFAPLPEVESRLRETRDESVTLTEGTLLTFKRAIERTADRFYEHPEDLDTLEALETLVSMVDEYDLAVDLRRVQNRYYRMRHTVRPAIEAHRWIELFDKLGAKLSFSLDVIPSRAVGEESPAGS
jgi:hypothetical protein